MGILHLLLFLGIPLFVLFGAKKFKWIDTISPVVICYALGLIYGNLGLPSDLFQWSNTLVEASVPLAIPLLLFSSHVRSWLKLTPLTLLAFGLLIVSVVVVAISAFYLFGYFFSDSAAATAMMIGIYTGGTPNLTAIGMSLNVSESMIVLFTGSDLLVGGIYLLFALTLGKWVLAKVLPPFNVTDSDTGRLIIIEEVTEPSNWWNSVWLTIISGLILVLSLGLSQLIHNKTNVSTVILCVTSLGILGGTTPLNKVKESYPTGNYFLLVFCLAIGSMADLSILYMESWNALRFCTYCLLGSVFLHMTLCRLMGVDRDTSMITSIAGLYGPAFIGPMAAALGNRQVIVSGLTTGLIGYAIGNYLGLFIYYLLTQ